MQLSIWEYLRVRVRESVLAGFNDAMDIVEQGDSNGSQHAAAQRFLSRLNPTAVSELPHPSVDVEISNIEPSPSNLNGQLQGTTPQTPQRPSEASAFDGDLQKRLESVTAQRASQGPSSAKGPRTTSPPASIITKRGPGRPRKDGVDDRA